MENRFHRFSVGSFSCIAARDGQMNYPIDAFFANAQRGDVQRVLQQQGLPTDRVTTPYTCLFVDTGEHRVAIDTGAGSLGVSAPKTFPTIDHASTVTGEFLDNLRVAGIDPATVDIVIVTHAHPDHIGGNLDDHGNPIFPNARWVIGGEEWDFWSSDRGEALAPARMVTIARGALAPVADRLETVADGDEIVPGIRALAAFGHTPGHLALEITARGETLLHVSDVVLFPLHLEHPDWVPAFDLLPNQAAATKQRIFGRAADEGLLVFAHHFPPFPSIGHVHRRDAGWQWKPVLIDERG